MKKPSAARDRILTTAHELFYRDGIRATGIDKVIAEAGVTKVTFYRHFPSKQDLILAYLDYRHRLWMDWFQGALLRHGDVVAAMQEWFESPDFRGCAFINAVGEMPETRDIVLRHKQEMIAALHRDDADAVALAIDGAILRAQYDSPEAAVSGLRRLLGGQKH